MGSPRTPLAAVGLAMAALVAAGPRAAATGQVRTVLTGADAATNPPVGSLRQILEDVAQPGDTIQFASNFSIRMDEGFRMTVPPGLTGLTIQGPAELRDGALEIRGDDTTVAGLRFTDCRVFVGTPQDQVDGSRPERVTVSDSTFVNDSGLQAMVATDCVFRDNTFDVRPEDGDCAVGDSAGEGAHWSHNTWTAGSVGGFSEWNGTDLLFDGGNTVVGNAIFGPRSGRIADNTVTGHLRVFHADQGFLGSVTVEGNTCGTLAARRPDLSVLDNTVTGRPTDRPKSLKTETVVRKPDGESDVSTQKELLVCPFSVNNGDVNGDAGTLTVKDNHVDGKDGWTMAMLVQAGAQATACTVEGNAVEGGKTNSVVVVVESAATVKKNVITLGAKKGAMVLKGAGAFTVEENTVDGSLGPGIVIEAGAGTATLTGNTATGCKSLALSVIGRRLVSVDGTYKDSGAGVRVGKSTVASFRGGAITGNRSAGLYADAASSVDVARVVFGGNTQAGIDLAPGGVTLNTKKKSANGNVPYPELLEFDAGTGRIKGRAEALARVDAYAVEEGARAGNPKNGEGVTWLGEVTAGADGKFTFPASGRVACPPSHRVTFTATRAGTAPVTSEFSLDVNCAGASLALIDQAPDGSPSNDQSDGSSTVLPERYQTISEDGRFVVFTSEGTNLVEGDTNEVGDVFLRDTALGTTTRVNRAAVGGGQVTYFESGYGDAGSAPSISADGRWICYTSRAEGSFGEGGWFNNDPGVILYDTQEGTNTIVVQPEGDPENPPGGTYAWGGVYYASMSGDGSAVIFSTRSQNTSAGDAGDDVDAIVWTRATGAYERVSVPTGGADRTNGWQQSNMTGVRLSHDARFAVFASTQDLSPGGTLPWGNRAWIRDRQSGTTEAACIDSTGAIRSGYDPWVSDDGRFVVFASGDALVPADTTGTQDIYLRDRQAGTTTLISAQENGTPLYGDSFEPCISGDGRYITFRTFEKVRLYDREENTWTVVSGSNDVPQANAYCYRPVLSRTGQFLRFESAATNLTDLDGQTFVSHVYLRDLSVTGE